MLNVLGKQALLVCDFWTEQKKVCSVTLLEMRDVKANYNDREHWRDFENDMISGTNVQGPQ